MNKAQGGTFGEHIVRLFTVRASSCQLAQLSLRRRSRPLAQEAHPSAPRVGNEVEISLNGRHSGAAFPGIKKEGLLLDVHPRAIAATSAKGIETGGMDEGRLELAKVARRDGQHFDCAIWLHKAREMPWQEFRREVEKELTGKEMEPHEIIYFKVYKSQIPVIEQALETAASMLGSSDLRSNLSETRNLLSARRSSLTP